MYKEEKEENGFPEKRSRGKWEGRKNQNNTERVEKERQDEKLHLL